MDSTANPKVFCMHQTYDNTEPDELNNRPGNGPWEEEQLPGWWHGELNSTRPPGVQALCRAVYSYQPANVDELPLYVGDVLEVLREVEEGWWQGRREGHVGVFPSNFVVMLEPPPGHAAPPFEPAPALPPKPVKEQCRVLFPYTAVNEDELTLAEGDVVTLVTKDTSDRGWWRGELHGRVGLFPDNFVQLLPADPIPNKITPTPEDESKGERPPAKTTNALYPSLSKYSEKTASVKELTTSKISMHKESSVSKESNIQSTVTITSKSEAEKTSHSKTTEGDVLKFSDEEVYASKFSAPKKPSVPLKKSPTPTSGVGGLFSGLKNKILPSSDKDKSEKPSAPQPASSNGEWDRPDGGGASKPAAPAAPAAPGATPFDHVERNSILNDPRAGRAKAPRRRPPSQALRDDTPQVIGLSNGHEVPVNKSPTDKLEEIKPRTREWEKHKAPWMEELKLNQAKKTSFSADGKSRSVSSSSEVAVASKAGGGSTDRSFSSRRHKTGSYNRILSCGLEEKRSTHSMEMSKSTSSISNRISVLESLESSLEAKARHSLETRKESPAREPEPSAAPLLHSPTAAGRTLTATLEDIKKPQAPAPIATRADPPSQSPSRLEKITTSSERTERTESAKISVESRSSTMERTEKIEDRATEGPNSVEGTLERRSHSKAVKERSEGSEALIAQLSNRILNLEKLLEVQNAKFNAAIEQLNIKLSLETERRLALQAEIEKLAHCVTQV